MTPEFKKVLDRTIRLYLKEIRDGCPDCRRYADCDRHREVVSDVVGGRTRRYFRINNNLKVTYLVQPGDRPGDG